LKGCIKIAKKSFPLSKVYGLIECRVIDTSMLNKYCFFILEVVKAWIDPAVKNARTIHHLGYGNFMVAGKIIKLKSKMKKRRSA
jgi:flavin reductase (DIM6/NTAB) family NADH-FMN oxidoreductase RutF